MPSNCFRKRLRCRNSYHTLLFSQNGHEMRNRVTLKDIALHTGKHVSTVSRALDPNRGHTISAKAVEQVRAAARNLGYRPNCLAAGLRTNRSMTVGIVIPDITNVVFPPIVRGIESILDPLGYASILVNTDSEIERGSRMVEVLRDRGVDGIVHAAALLSDLAIAEASDDGIPVVTVNRKLDRSRIPCVVNDERGGLRLVVQHLVDLGHRNIAHIAGPQDLSTGKYRLNAFRQVMDQLDLPAAPGLTVTAKRFDEKQGKSCASELLSRNNAFTAIACANDRLALGAIAHLKSNGIDCPRGISVTGFNDMPFLDFIQPGLTTIRIKQFEAGQAAAKRLYEAMSGDETDLPLETVLPVELIVRNSTDACRGVRST